MIRFTDMRAAGFLPHFLSEHDERDAVTQFNEQYAHGGGWIDLPRITLHGSNDEGWSLRYPGDPVFHEVSRAKLRDEVIVLFTSDLVAVIQPDGSYRVSRMD